MITKIRMPTKYGRQIPNPVRYVCSAGHIHPSRRKAEACNRKPVLRVALARTK
jgi:hypothetical protein